MLPAPRFASRLLAAVFAVPFASCTVQEGPEKEFEAMSRNSRVPLFASPELGEALKRRKLVFELKPSEAVPQVQPQPEPVVPPAEEATTLSAAPLKGTLIAPLPQEWATHISPLEIPPTLPPACETGITMPTQFCPAVQTVPATALSPVRVPLGEAPLVQEVPAQETLTPTPHGVPLQSAHEVAASDIPLPRRKPEAARRRIGSAPKAKPAPAREAVPPFRTVVVPAPYCPQGFRTCYAITPSDQPLRFPARSRFDFTAPLK